MIIAQDPRKTQKTDGSAPSDACIIRNNPVAKLPHFPGSRAEKYLYFTLDRVSYRPFLAKCYQKDNSDKYNFTKQTPKQHPTAWVFALRVYMEKCEEIYQISARILFS